MNGGAPRGPGRRAVLACVAGAAALTGAAAPAAATTTPSADADDALPLHVAVVEVTPTTYAADDPARSLVSVRARVRNDGEEALEGLSARLVAQRSPVVARSSLDRWESADDDASLGRTAVTSGAVDVAGGTLEPGEEAEVLLTLEASALGDAEGAHPAAVEVVTGDGERAGLARTFLVSTPAGVRTTLLTLLLPLVAGRVREADGLAEEVAGRLGRLVDASGDPRTSWAVDPAVLATTLTTALAVPEPGAGTAVEGEAPPAPALEVPVQDAALPPGTDDPARTVAVLTAWRERLAAAAAGRSVVALPHGDPDLTALTAVAAGAELLATADAAGVDVAASLDAATVLTGVAWPVDEDAGPEVLTLAARAGATAVVLDDEALPARDELTYAPTGRADVEVGGTSLTGLIADRALSQLLQRAAVPASPEAEDLAEDEVAAALVQRVLAEVATITLQRPSDPRSLLVVAARSFDPRPAVVQRLVAAVEASGWASWQPLPDLLVTPVPDVERAAAPEPDAVSLRAALPPAHVVAVRDALTTLGELREALTGAAPATAAAQRSALMLLAASWRGHLPELRVARAGLQEDAAALLRAVRVVPGSVLNLAATRTELPVTIVNELFAPVRVELVLRPRSPRVQLAEVPVQTVPPRGQVRVGVPVRAVANGSVVVEAQLRTPSGLPLGEPVGLDVNVRADLEGWLTGLVGGGAGALLVVGLVRAVRRGRRRVDAVPHADVGGAGDTAGDTAEHGAGEHGPPGAAGDGERRERPSAPTGQG
ncbi:DUF6049 family protein [Kineococcus sp. G2]|uniref:DUF6049 family protein n=1 Tax=Kineococcus sp. G2 TaxID=3127484 RepID=UPI00301D7211